MPVSVLASLCCDEGLLLRQLRAWIISLASSLAVAALSGLGGRYASKYCRG